MPRFFEFALASQQAGTCKLAMGPSVACCTSNLTPHPSALQVQVHGTRWAQVYDAYVRKGRISQQRTQVGRQGRAALRYALLCYTAVYSVLSCVALGSGRHLGCLFCN